LVFPPKLLSNLIFPAVSPAISAFIHAQVFAPYIHTNEYVVNI
jgi:hypothetical protein